MVALSETASLDRRVTALESALAKVAEAIVHCADVNYKNETTIMTHVNELSASISYLRGRIDDP